MATRELFLENVRKYIRPQTDPVAVRLVWEDETPPEGAVSPVEKFGYPLTICQGVSAARRMGMTMVFRREDHACPPGALRPGLSAHGEPARGEGGHAGLRGHGGGGEENRGRQRPAGEGAAAIWLAPYESAAFEPDIVLVYGNSAQATRLAQGYAYYTGDGVASYTLGRLACASYINKVYVRQEPTIVIPGGGERVFGSTQDDELVFALPAKFLETTARGVEAVHQAGYARYPTGFHGVTARPKLPGKYYKYLMPTK